MKILSTIAFLLCVCEFMQCANILSIAPALDVNFKTLYLPLWRKLAEKGHKITLITTVMMEPNKNITQIDVSKYYQFENNMGDSPYPFRTPSMFDLMASDKNMLAKLNDPSIQALKTESFDLIFLELALPFWPSFPAFYGCPYIGINTKDASPLVHYHAGNAMHPAIYPLTDRFFEYEGLQERILSTVNTLFSFLLAEIYLDRGTDFMSQFFDAKLPNSLYMYNGMSLMFINANPIFHPPRPVVPTTINLGGFLSIAEPQALPQDLEKYLNGTKDGCIYVSFGTTVNSDYLSKEQKDIFVSVFKEMAPMKVLWKFDDLNVAKGVENIEVRNWLPQQDVLRHPNVKYFITQGGLQSMEEAIDSAVPMLGMPFYGDQINNVNKMHHKKFGVKLLPKEMTKQSLKASLEELMKNPIYETNIKKLSAISKDQPMKGLEKAVWWTEYVLRHGTQHLRSPSADIPLYQYFFLDVIAFLLVFSYCSYRLVKSVIKLTLSMIRALYRFLKRKDRYIYLETILSILGILRESVLAKTMMKLPVFSLSVFLVFGFSNCANILAVVPSPFLSHQMTYRPIWTELARRGHNITLITTDPMEENENITQIDFSGTYDMFNSLGIKDVMVKNFSLVNVFNKFKEVADTFFEYQFNHPGLVRVMQNPDGFDLIMIEMLMPKWTSITHKIKAPFIGLTTMDAPPFLHALLGNSMHPAIYPMLELGYSAPLSFRERLISTGVTVGLKYLNDLILRPFGDRYGKLYFGDDCPASSVIDAGASLVFMNANPILFPTRPITPITINLQGGLHLLDPRPLPKDLQTYLDQSKEGFIYFSFGSTVDSNALTPEVLEIFKKTFENLSPIRVLWKFANETLPGKPKNVEIRKWLPQQDVLRHPNIKLFITQGGLQSMEEALEYGVPMLGVPFFGDQLHNVKRMVTKQLGLSLELSSITETSLMDTIKELLNNPLYKNTIDRYSKIQRDRPMKALETAIWWTEYVLRHGGTDHLRSPSANIPLYQYFFLDVIAFIVVVVAILAIVSVFMFRFSMKIARILFRKMFKRKSEDEKVKQQ
ncbi:uncharacterized protein LOC123314144 [Coccinella septempunctata]|uniref:uncharacterized protein LOC123314144 n=1 Tax=Coccinella septempunctata TaxID=41139 RepID=UPI001D089565|nr:uncharacterized protein LOC123314144 [Coccinella septempunctata]